jgi:RHS repeat-associated protein
LSTPSFDDMALACDVGEYTDAETGFTYLRARYYDPATGQFISRDPIEALTHEPYGYVGGNPLNATDPLGLFCLFSNSKGCIGLQEIAKNAQKPLQVIGVVSSQIAAVTATAAAVCAVGVVTAAVCSLPLAGVAGVAGGISTASTTASAIITCSTEGIGSQACKRNGATALLSLATMGVAARLGPLGKAAAANLNAAATTASYAAGRRQGGDAILSEGYCR